MAVLVKGSSIVRSFSTPFDYGQEVYKSVTIDPDGTCYMIGDTVGPLENDWSGKSKVFVHRYKGGSRVWQKVFKQDTLDYYSQPERRMDGPG